MSFHLPPLRERVQDIAPLVRGMAARYNLRFRKNLSDIRPEAMAALESFEWPGNIRQLENVVQQAVLVSKGTELTLEDVPAFVRQGRPVAVYTNGNGHHHPPVNGDAVSDLRALAEGHERNEKAVIRRALETHNYSRTQAAHALGISRVTLYKKMKKYGLDQPRRGEVGNLSGEGA
jgi:DNA-binding NtrC family response regulator